MPSKYTVKQYIPNSYYHAYNRGVAKQTIFHDAQDKRQFLKIIARHLDSQNTETRYDGVIYEKYHDNLDILCYCLMGNHFHLLVYVKDDPKVLKKFMQSVSIAYSMYFNRRHKRVGGLFQGVYKASRITNDSYLSHISRYIHLNPRNYKKFYYSSLRYYYRQEPPNWLNPNAIIDLYSCEKEYMDFLNDYNDSIEILDELKYELADYQNIYPLKRHRFNNSNNL